MKLFSAKDISKMVDELYSARWSVGKDYFEAAYALEKLARYMEANPDMELTDAIHALKQFDSDFI